MACPYIRRCRLVKLRTKLQRPFHPLAGGEWPPWQHRCNDVGGMGASMLPQQLQTQRRPTPWPWECSGPVPKRHSADQPSISKPSLTTVRREGRHGGPKKPSVDGRLPNTDGAGTGLRLRVAILGGLFWRSMTALVHAIGLRSAFEICSRWSMNGAQHFVLVRCGNEHPISVCTSPGEDFQGRSQVPGV